jgi:hypothetical protein
MPTFEDVHAGDVVLLHDQQTWGVAAKLPGGGVTFVRHGAVMTAYPPVGTEATVVQAADVSAEVGAAGVLLAAGLGPIEIISERWES